MPRQDPPISTVTFPDPPLATIAGTRFQDATEAAWKKQKADAAEDYQDRDDGSGSISNVGSPMKGLQKPSGKGGYVERYSEAVSELSDVD